MSLGPAAASFLDQQRAGRESFRRPRLKWLRLLRGFVRRAWVRPVLTLARFPPPAVSIGR
jgi:hypothetical protein